MPKGAQLIEGRWRIAETEMWDPEALDLVVPAHITFGRNGQGEMQLIAIGASIDYRVAQRDGAPVVEFTWSGFDEMDPSNGRGRARIEGDTIRGTLFIHQGDQSGFVATRERVASEKSGANTPLQPRADNAMRTRKKIPYGQPIDVAFTDRERVLIAEHTFADPELTAPLDAAERRGTKLITKYTLDDLDALLGFVAAEANHTQDRKLEKRLRVLFARLSEEMERYDDGEWQSSV